MVDDSMHAIERDDELDRHRVHEIVTEVFQRKELPPPNAIEWKQRGPSDTKPQAHFDDECLWVVASTEPELKRLIGRFVIERVWSRHDWLLATRFGTYAAIGALLVMTLPAIGVLLALMFPALRVWILIATSIIVMLLALWTSYHVSIKHAKLLNDFTVEMADSGCMTEYDSKDYAGDYYLVTVGSMIVNMCGVVIILATGIIFYLQDMVLMGIFMLQVILLAFAAAAFFFISAWKSIGLNLCYENDDPDNEVIEFENSEYLQTAFTDVIEKADLWSSLALRYKTQINAVRAGFSETRYAQCRGIYEYVEDGTLYINANDLSKVAAKRYGAALLATGSLRFYSELSLRRRAIPLIGVFFGLAMLVVVLAASFVSKEFGIVTIVFTSFVYSKMWHIDWKQNEEVRRDLPLALQRTEVFNDYELSFYCNRMFSTTSRFDLSFIIGFHVVLIIIGYLALAFT